jgi:CrcB protein
MVKKRATRPVFRTGGCRLNCGVSLEVAEISLQPKRRWSRERSIPLRFSRDNNPFEIETRSTTSTDFPNAERRKGSHTQTYLIVALGGAIGALCRHGVSVAMGNALGHAALGTFVANISGAFLLGFFMTLAEERIAVSLDVRRFVAVGILGSYTTFSILSHQTWELIESGNMLGAIANALGSLIAGLFAVFTGIVLARRTRPSTDPDTPAAPAR